MYKYLYIICVLNCISYKTVEYIIYIMYIINICVCIKNRYTHMNAHTHAERDGQIDRLWCQIHQYINTVQLVMLGLQEFFGAVFIVFSISIYFFSRLTMSLCNRQERKKLDCFYSWELKNKRFFKAFTDRLRNY